VDWCGFSGARWQAILRVSPYGFSTKISQMHPQYQEIIIFISTTQQYVQIHDAELRKTL